jgi:hypothetical protein
MDQKQKALELARELVSKIENAQDFVGIHMAVFDFVTAMSSPAVWQETDIGLSVIGDDSLLRLAAGACMQRGKSRDVAVRLFAKHFST